MRHKKIKSEVWQHKFLDPCRALTNIDLWPVGYFDSNAHVHCWILGHVVFKHWGFITDETASCFVCRHEWYFVCKSYEIFLFCRSFCWTVVLHWEQLTFGTLCMIKLPVFGLVITQHATIRSHARTNYS